MSGIPGIYYDGRSSHAHSVEADCAGGELRVHGDGIERAEALARIAPSAPLAGVPYTLRFADGARLQLPADAPVADWFPRRHRLERQVARWERRTGVALAAIAVIAIALFALFGWGVPAAADYAALHLPKAIDRAVGEQSLALLRARWLRPTELPAAERARLQRRFRAFAARSGDADTLHLEFCRSPALGANALSLGGGIIVVTDEMVRALPDDDAFLAVVAHEMGHQRYHHTLRMVLRGSGVAIIASVLVGDVSGGTLAAAIPVFLLNAHYSRDFEQQADDYAFASLARAGISPMAFVRAMRALEQAHPELRADEPSRYLSTHPLTAARIARAEAAARVFERSRAATAPPGSLAPLAANH